MCPRLAIRGWVLCRHCCPSQTLVAIKRYLRHSVPWEGCYIKSSGSCYFVFIRVAAQSIELAICLVAVLACRDSFPRARSSSSSMRVCVHGLPSSRTCDLPPTARFVTSAPPCCTWVCRSHWPTCWSALAWSKWPGSQQPLRPTTAPEAHPLAQGCPQDPRGEPSPRGCRGEATAALWCLPNVAHSAAFDHLGARTSG